jgi:hypothetical protein
MNSRGRRVAVPRLRCVIEELVPDGLWERVAPLRSLPGHPPFRVVQSSSSDQGRAPVEATSSGMPVSRSETCHRTPICSCRPIAAGSAGARPGPAIRTEARTAPHHERADRSRPAAAAGHPRTATSPTARSSARRTPPPGRRRPPAPPATAGRCSSGPGARPGSTHGRRPARTAAAAPTRSADWPSSTARTHSRLHSPARDGRPTGPVAGPGAAPCSSPSPLARPVPAAAPAAGARSAPSGPGG